VGGSSPRGTSLGGTCSVGGGGGGGGDLYCSKALGAGGGEGGGGVGSPVGPLSQRGSAEDQPFEMHCLEAGLGEVRLLFVGCLFIASEGCCVMSCGVKELCRRLERNALSVAP
jgi:hypothetical protein